MPRNTIARKCIPYVPFMWNVIVWQRPASLAYLALIQVSCTVNILASLVFAKPGRHPANLYVFAKPEISRGHRSFVKLET